MFEIDEIYEFIPEGMFANLDEFTSYTNKNGVGDFYEYIPEGMFESEEQFTKGLKKKDVTESKSEGGSLAPSEITPSDEQESSFTDKINLGDNFKSGVKSLGSIVSRIPMGVQELTAATIGFFDKDYDEYINSLDPQSRETLLGATANAAGGVGGGGTSYLNEKSRELKAEADAINSTLAQYDTGMVEDIFAGKIGQGTARLINAAAETGPSLLAAFVPGGIIALGAGAGAAKSRDLQEKGERLGVATMSNALVTGVAEGFFEKYTRGLGKGLFKALKGGTKKVVESSIKSALINFRKSFVGEGTSELATLTTEKLADRLITGDEEAFTNYFSEAADTFVLGGVMGGGTSLTTSSIGAYKTLGQGRQRKAIATILNDSDTKNLSDPFKNVDGPINETQIKLVQAPDSKSYLEGTLEGQVSRNEITKAEKQTILNNYDKIKSLTYELDGININEGDRIPALKLLAEKKGLESQIAGKDEALVKSQRNRIQEINTELENISERSGAQTTIKELTKDDAVKALLEEGVETPSDQDIINKLDELNKLQQDESIPESGTTGVPVQKSPGDSETLGARDNQSSIIAEEKKSVSEKSTNEQTQENQDQVEETDQEGGEITLDFAPTNIPLKKPVKEGGNEVLVGRDAELEAEVIERKLNKAKEKGTNPETVVVDLQRRLALEQNNAEFFADYIEDFLSGKVSTPFSKWRKGPKKAKGLDQKTTKQPKTKLQKEIDKSITPPITKVTVNEKAALKDQIKLEARSAREANISAKKKIKKLTVAIKKIGKKGNLTPKQTQQIISKLNKTNIDNQVQINELVEFADKVSRDVDYSTKLSEASKARDKAVSNLSGGNIGANRNFNAAISKVLNIPLESLNSEQLVEYTEFVKDYSGKRGQIKLGKAESITEKASALYNKLLDDITISEPVVTQKQINQTNKVVEEINNKDISGEQLIKDNKDFIENKLDNIDTPTLYNLVDKLNKAETKESSETVKKVNDYAKIRQKLIDDISKSVVKSNKVDIYSQEFAGRYEDVTKNDLVDLTGAQLEQFQIHVDNINNGFYTHKANVLMNSIQANQQSNEVVPILSKLTKNKIARGASLVYGKIKGIITGKSKQLEIARSNPLSVIDDVYGNFKGRQIYNNVFDPFGRAVSKKEGADSEVLSIVSSIESDIASRAGQTTNKSVKKRYKITMYLNTLEAESNPNKIGVAPGVEWAKITVDSYKPNTGSIYNDADIQILKELIIESEGKSSQEIYNTMDAGTKRATKKIQGVYKNSADKAAVASTIIRGDKLDAIDNYVHHYVSVDKAQLKKEATDAVANVNRDLTNKPSTQSVVAKERTKGVKPIDFDPINSLIRSTRETNLDYYVTNALRVGGKTVRSISDKTQGLDQIQEQGAQALQDAYNEMVQVVISNNISAPLNTLQKTFQKTRALGYYAALSSVPRAGGELASNLSYVMVASPSEFITGAAPGTLKYSLNYNNDGLNVARNIGSKSFSRLFGKEKLSGSKAEKGGISEKKSPTRAKEQIANEVSRLTNSIPDKIKSSPIKLADALLSLPDKSIARPLFFGTLISEFKNITNQKLDLKKLAENDLEYIRQNKKAILQATRAADTAVQRAAASTNPADVILKNQFKPDDSVGMTVYRTANSFMSKFSINEYATGRQAVASMIGQGEMTPLQGAQTVLALNLRMASYLIIGETLRNLMMVPFEAEEEKDYKSMLKQSVLGSAVSLISRKTLGNVPMLLINWYIENLNKEYGSSLRGGKEYDAYRDSIVFSQIAQDRAVEDFWLNVVKASAGPYVIYGKMVYDLAKLGANLTDIRDEEDYDKKQELKEKTDWLRNIIQVTGNFGILPFYKDIFSIYKTKKYRDRKKDKEKNQYY